MMRKIATVLFMLVILAPVAHADADSPVALLRSGRTFVPIRAVGELLGATVNYASGKVEVTTATAGSVHLTVGGSSALVNGIATSLDAPPFIVEGTCYVPLRFVSEALGAQVSCDTPCRIVRVTVAGNELPLTVVIDRSSRLTYQGTWFDISYPRGFTVIEREASPSGMGYDGVSFEAPDGTVEFYVFSPQWSGTSEWAMLRQGETVEDRKQQREGDKVVTWVEVATGDAAGRRAWVETVNPALNVNHYFGIWYMHQEDYDRYKSSYVAFKGSLVQYAD